MSGDFVQVQLDIDVFKLMQNEDHGGWNDRMAVVKINSIIYNLLCLTQCSHYGILLLCSLLVVLAKLST